MARSHCVSAALCLLALATVAQGACPDWASALDKVNEIRSGAGLPALAWSTRLEAAADAWSRYLIKSCDARPSGARGESVFQGTGCGSMCTTAVQSWAQEGVSDTDSVTLHMLSKTATAMGCSASTAADGACTIITCRFSPTSYTPVPLPELGLSARKLHGLSELFNDESSEESSPHLEESSWEHSDEESSVEESSWEHSGEESSETSEESSRVVIIPDDLPTPARRRLTEASSVEPSTTQIFGEDSSDEESSEEESSWEHSGEESSETSEESSRVVVIPDDLPTPTRRRLTEASSVEPSTTQIFGKESSEDSPHLEDSHEESSWERSRIEGSSWEQSEEESSEEESSEGFPPDDDPEESSHEESSEVSGRSESSERSTVNLDVFKP